MGVLPVEFTKGENAEILGLNGTEKYTLLDIEKNISPGCKLELIIERSDTRVFKINVLCRIDTNTELEYYRNGGILNFVLRNLINS